MTNEKITRRGECRICYCTEGDACLTDNGPCAWADKSQTLCTNPDCLAAAEAEEKNKPGKMRKR